MRRWTRRVLTGTRSVVDGASTVMAVVAATLIVALMLATIVDITLRRVTGTGVTGVTEAGEVTLVAIVYLGLAYAQRTGSHVSVDLVTERLPHVLGRGLELLGLLVVTVALLWVVRETGARALAAVEVREYRFGQVSVPTWPARVLIPVGLSMLLVQLWLTAFERMRLLPPRPAATTPAAGAVGS
jgi:TRAP-type C4-dicarboxylate transport system permease small subunit